MGRSTTRQASVKYYNSCRTCNDNISGKGKCKLGYDNYYHRISKNNQCPKCEEERNKKSYR